MFFSQARIRPNIQHSPQLNRLIKGNTYSIHQLLWDLFPEQAERSFLYREEIAREQLGVKRGVRGEPIFYLVSKEPPAEDNSLLAIKRKLYSPKLHPGDKLAFKLRANPIQIEKKERSSQEMEDWKAKRKDQKHPTKKRARHDVVMDSQRKLLIELSSMLSLSGTGKKSELKGEVLLAMSSSGNQQVKDRMHDVINENERFRNSRFQGLGLSDQIDLALKAYVDKRLEEWIVNKSKKNGFELVRDEKRDRLKFQAESYRWHNLPKKGKTAGFSSIDFDGVLKVTDFDLFKTMLFNGIGPAKAFGCGLMLVRRV